jgi:DNA-binding NtrC family response regulator
MIKVCLIEDNQAGTKEFRKFLDSHLEYHIQVVNDSIRAQFFIDASYDFAILHTEEFSLDKLEYAKRLLSGSNNLPLIVVSPDKNHESMEAFIEEGVFDCIIADDFIELKLRLALKKVERQVAYNREYERMYKSRDAFKEFKYLIGRSFEAERISLLIYRAQVNTSPVCIIGETGTGKEMIAKSIHEGINWRYKPFVSINTKLVSNDLLEDLLFGHELKGSNAKIGALEEANDGILFINNIEYASKEVQAKLYRVVLEGVFTRVGGTNSIDCKCKLIFGSIRNGDVYESEGYLHEKLNDYLMRFTIRLSPLREQKGDIVLLANLFLSEFSLNERAQIKKISNEAIDELLSHNWPGNIRELKATLQLAFVLAEGKEIRKQDIRIQRERVPGEYQYFGKKTLKEYNKEIIESYLAEYDNDLETVSGKLKIGKSTLYRMIKNKEIERK